jgi:Xaa-Pro aminopeptidase
MPNYVERLSRVRAAMTDWGVDFLYLNYGPDFTYLSGILRPMYYEILKGGGDWITGLLISQDRDPVLILHPSFAIKVAEQTWIADIRVLPAQADPQEFFATALRDLGVGEHKIGISKMLWGQTLLGLQAALPSATFIPATNDMMDRVRSIKDAEEIGIMRRAGEITDQALAATLSRMYIGMSEADVATEVVYQIRQHGGDDYSFYPGIICVGNGSEADRHIFTRNTNMRLDAGTTVAFDFGVLYQGYCSDFGRSAFMGEPLPEALAAYRSITNVNKETMKVMADGQITPHQIADFASELVKADGFADHYMYYGLGHAIGLEVHEAPWLKPGYEDPIRSGMCFTVEPKIWKPGVFYVRCEDVVVVGPDGATPLTLSHYEPNIIE